MDTNATTSAVRDLIAENKLEEALSLLMGAIKTRNDRSLDAVILLKGKLSLLEEQENAGVLELEDILREKAKISRSLLDILSDLDNLPVESAGLSTAALSGSPLRKPMRNYLLLSAGVLAVLVTLFFLFQKNQPSSGLPGEKIGAPVAENTAPGEAVPLEEFEFTLPLPLNRPFRIGDVDYTLQSAGLIKHADPVPPNPGMVKLTLHSYLIGKTKGTGGVSWREQKVRVRVDDVPFAPMLEEPSNSGWINVDARAEHNLAFAIPDNGKKYELEFSYEQQVRRFPFAFSQK